MAHMYAVVHKPCVHADRHASRPPSSPSTHTPPPASLPPTHLWPPLHVQAAPMLFAGLLPRLAMLLSRGDAELQQLGAQLLARCSLALRKRGLGLSATTDASIAQLVSRQLLPCLRSLARGASAARSSAGGGSGRGSQDTEEQEEADGPSLPMLAELCAPKAAKWAVLALAACQDPAHAAAELAQLADELAGRLDATAPETAALLQALSVIGRLEPRTHAAAELRQRHKCLRAPCSCSLLLPALHCTALHC